MIPLTVIKHEKIAEKTYSISLKGSSMHNPGEFINIKVSNHFLRRPFSVADQEKDEIRVIYKIFGSGTEALSKVNVGDTLDCLTHLGQGFSFAKEENIYLIGGGIGIPPLYFLAKKLHKLGKKLTIILGFNEASELFLVNEFKALGEVHIATRDGSEGEKGTVIDLLKGHTIEYFYAVGPTLMLKALVKEYQNGQVSLEERMGCGFGACMGCSIKTKTESQRVCKEGPVFDAKELLWND